MGPQRAAPDVVEPTLAPRPHQRAMADDCVAGLAAHDRGQLIAACGSGKTLVSAWIALALGARRIVFAAPSLMLLRQTAEEWARVGLQPTLYVCSDKGLGPDVTTDPGRILAALVDPDAVVFTTYHSADLLGPGLAVHPADLLIADEAHHLAGADAKRHFSFLLDDDLAPIRKRLAMTATPRVLGRRGGEDAWFMDDDPAGPFGPVFHRLTFGRAIEMGILCDYRILGVKVRASRAALPDEVDAAITAAIKNEGLTHAVAFRNRVDKADATARRFGTGAVSLTGRTPASRRMREATATLDAGGLVFTAKALGEGGDTKKARAVVFFDAKRSKFEIAQNIGRALRIDDEHPEKVAMVVIPLLIDEHGAYNPRGMVVDLLEILRGISEVDERMEAAILHRALVGRGLAKETEAMKRWDREHGIAALLSDHAIREARLVDIDGMADSWDIGFAALLRFVARGGHALVPESHVEGSFPLGLWVGKRRQLHRLSKEPRASRLEALPGWAWNARDASWERSRTEVVAWVAAHGRLPDVSAPPTLSSWCAHQRMCFRRGSLSAERIALCERIPGWAWSVKEAGLSKRVNTRRATEARSRASYLTALGCESPRALAVRLRAIRKAHGLTGVELARRLGVSPSAVKNREVGQQVQTPDSLRRWCEACGTTLEAEFPGLVEFEEDSE